MTKPLIDFIIPTYNRTSQLLSMLSSLNTQQNDNFVATVVTDGEPFKETIEIVNLFKRDNFRIISTDMRYNDYGHTPRNLGKNKSEATYIIMSGDDNYYVPSFTNEIMIASINNPGMIYWDMITNNWINYTWFETKISTGYIDMGAFATRNDIAKQINLEPSCFAADHAFVMEFNKRFPDEKTIKINKILFVHN